MKIIFAQGNPEAEYARTRHNVGFQMANMFAEKHSAPFVKQTKFQAEIAEFLHGDKILIVKPTTFYNDTGISLNALRQFYKVDPSDILVIHDELALPFGTIRSRIGGSDAGNNGIKSINQHGGEVTKRLRIGIGNSLRSRMGDVNFVLGTFSKEESDALASTVIPHCLELMYQFLDDSFPVTSQSLIDNLSV